MKLLLRKNNQKTTHISKYGKYLQSLPVAETALLEQFFADFNSHNRLAPREKSKMRADFENALLYYASVDLAPEEARARLAIKNLGGFYSRPPIVWYALDNAAKVYPLSMKHGQMSMFRISMYLKAPVVPELLQMALTFTIKRFPTFATTVKKGFFWHYLDTAKRRYTIQKETEIPCKPLKISGSSSQSFRALYYDNRVSVEFFHILTDGAGGMVFLKTLIAEYLRLSGVVMEEKYDAEGILDISEAPSQNEAVNEFSRAEKTAAASGFMDKPAVQMSGKLSRTKPCRVLHFKMDAVRLKEAAARNGATITSYMLALVFVAGKHATDELDGIMSIQTPVDMRRFYPSDTLRNFSMYCGIKLPLRDITDTQSIIPGITLQLSEKASKGKMSEMLNSTERMVGAMRYVPLFIKAPVARIGYGFLSDRIFSNTISNLGVVSMPSALAEHIESMDFVLGGALTNRASCAMVTFNNTVTFSISKCTADPSFEEKLYELLASDGVTPVVEGSMLYEN